MAGPTVTKCTELSVSIDLTQLPQEFSTDLGELRQRLQNAINTTQPVELQLTARPIHAAANGNRAAVRIKARGQQEPMKSFGTFARNAFRTALEKLQADLIPIPVVPPGLAALDIARPRRPLFGRIERVENDEGEDEIRRIGLQGPAPEAIEALIVAMPMAARLAAVAVPSILDVAPIAVKPEPFGEPYHGCTPRAAEGDHQLNRRKNRTDSAVWNLVSISSILDLGHPAHLSKNRDNWTPQQVLGVAQFEGIPVQVVGWLVDLDKEGSETCNCSSCDDVDYHLWVVDGPEKINDKTQALVAEITPRISKDNADDIADGVRAAKTPNGLRQIRISGWLMLDQMHLSQVGRPTPWEIHPIIKFDIQDPDTGEWIPIFEPEQ